MTPVVLLEELKKFITEHTKDIMLSTRVRKEGNGASTRAVKVYKTYLPINDEEENQVPYVLLQFLTGKDEQKPGSLPESECKIRIIIATYLNEDSEEGVTDVLNIIMRLRLALSKSEVIGGQFVLKKPLEYIVYPNNISPYFAGEIMTNWEIPTIEREVILDG